MIFSRATAYTIQALIELAKWEEGLSISELAEITQLSRHFLAKLFQALGKEGIVVSTKGVKGGFKLKRRPEEITIGKIFRVIEGRNAMTFYCVEDGECIKSRESRCQTGRFFQQLHQELYSVLDSYTLADLLEL
ncbi:MAG: Rrf2 family transcriptional regulator [Campylobacterales bacterium]